MKITKCIHVTATEKKHLKAFFDSGKTDAKINRKIYSIISETPQGDKFLYEIRITTPMRDDYGNKKFNHQTIEVLI